MNKAFIASAKQWKAHVLIALYIFKVTNTWLSDGCIRPTVVSTSVNCLSSVPIYSYWLNDDWIHPAVECTSVNKIGSVLMDLKSQVIDKGIVEVTQHIHIILKVLTHYSDHHISMGCCLSFRPSEIESNDSVLNFPGPKNPYALAMGHIWSDLWP